MSHFNVLVIGANIERQLQPYHQFECTGFDDQYVKEVSIIDDVQESVDRHRAEGGTRPVRGIVEDYGLPVVSRSADVEREGAHKYGYAIVRGSKIIAAVNRTNPDAKWDGWRVGGRWSNWLKIRSGEYVTSCKIKDVAWIQMEHEPRRFAERSRKIWMEIVAEHGSHLPWPHYLEKHGGKNDAARRDYRSQPAVKALGERREMEFMSADRLAEDNYIEKYVRDCVTPYAIVKDGKWHAQGEMGGFGVSHSEVDDWPRIASEILASVHKNTTVTVVDCHI